MKADSCCRCEVIDKQNAMHAVWLWAEERKDLARTSIQSARVWAYLELRHDNSILSDIEDSYIFVFLLFVFARRWWAGSNVTGNDLCREVNVNEAASRRTCDVNFAVEVALVIKVFHYHTTLCTSVRVYVHISSWTRSNSFVMHISVLSGTYMDLLYIGCWLAFG